MDYSYNLHNMRVKNKYNAPVGSIRLHISDDETAAPYQVNLSRVSGGYMLHTPLYVTEKTNVHWVFMKAKEYKWFLGIRGRYEF